MNKLFTYVLAAIAFVACTQNEVEELTANRADVPETLTVGFEGGDTRVELNEALKTVWTEGDEVSVYFYSDANQKWQYQGETGERLGTLRRVDASVATTQTDYVVVAYPYNTSYTLNRINANLIASLPAVQSYKEGSYGAEGNIMVAQSEFTQFSLKSVCGWLRVELTGKRHVVNSITLRGNAGEQVAGLIYVDTATAEAILASEMGEASDEEQVGGIGGGLEFDDTVFTEVTLDCGDGVELGAEATAFYIALLPQTFEKGMTIDINYANAESQTLVCENSITISRNHISPIGIEANEEADVPTNQLWYTATALVEPYKSSAFNVAITSNKWDEATGEGVITFDGELTTIGYMAFDGCDSLTSVTIPDSVTTIGSYAFYDCDSLTSVTIPDSVTTIGNNAFYYCSNLTSVTIPDSVTTIGGAAFSYCDSLTSVTIPDSVTTIGDGVFADCSNLAEFKGKFAADGGRCLIKDNTIIAYAEASGTTYTIPDSVTTIGEAAFRGCNSLTSVTIPDSVTTIGDWAFYYCSSLTSITIPDSVMTIGWYAFEYCRSLTSVTIGDSVTTIGDYAFRGCDSLTSVTIGDSVTTIGDYAFDDCGSLTSVTIGDSVTTIGDYAFSGCYNLTSVTIGNSVMTIGDYAFDDCGSLTSVTIPDSVTTIGDYAFDDCGSLTSVTIPDSVTRIGSGAFGGCINLAEFTGKFAEDGGRCLIIDGVLNAFAFGCGVTEYTIPDSVTSIGKYAFAFCESLTSVTIPDSVTTIGYRAFSACESLTSVTIPDSVTTIGYRAFSACESLTSVYCEATTPPHIAGDVFDENSTDRKIYVYEECVDAYKTAWSEFADSIVAGGNIPESVTTTILYTTSDGVVIDASKFPVKSHTYNNGVGELILYGELKAIPDRTFYEFGTLTTITIPDSVTTIGKYAFEGCISLTSVTIGDSVTTIGEAAFRGCNSLTSVTIPDSVTTIGEYAFYLCTSLTSVTIGDSVTTIGYQAFRDCYSLTSVTIPDSVTTIGNSAFYLCTSLTSVTIGDSVTTIGNDAFWSCDSLTSVTIPDSVTTIGEGAFGYCDSLISITIPDSVTTIGGSAFLFCQSLTSVTIGESVTTIGSSAFYSCDSLTSVTIPDSVTTIGKAAFASCSSLAEFKGKFAADGGRCLIKDNTLIAYANTSGTTYTIPDSVTTIGDNAFYNCGSLTSVTIPDSVTTIGRSAFYNCTSLTSVYCKATTPPSLGDYAFKYYRYYEYVKIGCPIYVPAESVEAYKAAAYWSDYAADIVGYDFE